MMKLTNDIDLIEHFLAIVASGGIPVNPELPEDWDNTPHEERPACHSRIWEKPYIRTERFFEDGEITEEEWCSYWPEGTRYDVHCLDGGAWDRPTCRGSFSTLEDAIRRAKQVAAG